MIHLGGISMRTTFMANDQNVERKWLVVDAEDETLGRLASEVATLLRGKHKPTFTPHVDTGDYVIIVKDRKSTRLNSSHVAISYAVFCLKKKTTKLNSLPG